MLFLGNAGSASFGKLISSSLLSIVMTPSVASEAPVRGERGLLAVVLTIVASCTDAGAFLSAGDECCSCWIARDESNAVAGTGAAKATGLGVTVGEIAEAARAEVALAGTISNECFSK